MGESMPFPAHVTRRGDIYQYVRRVPNDIRDAIGVPRIQKSLRTSSRSEAFARAARINDEVERHFADARARLGIELEIRDMSDWTASDWDSVARWLEARFIQDDLERRLPRMTGATLTKPTDTPSVHWSDDTVLREKITLRTELEHMTTAEYATTRIGFINTRLRPLGLSILPTSPHLISFSAQCLRAELSALDTFDARERGEQIRWAHPDEIDGKWRPKLPATEQSVTQKMRATAPEPGALPTPSSALSSHAEQLAGKTLSDCSKQWEVNRKALKLSTRTDYLNEMQRAINQFESFTNLTDIATIRRHHIISFRAHLKNTTGNANSTVNKVVNFITTLLKVAEQQAWIENAVRGSIHLPIPQEEENSEPYDSDDLNIIFNHPMFTQRKLHRTVKSSAELQFWLPLISCYHGMISSEILQLGPDTIAQYPNTDILCFQITTAGNRRAKTVARRRYLPIHKLIISLGFLDIVENAKKEGRSRIWSAIDINPETLEDNSTEISKNFSSFWSYFSRKKLLITNSEKTLYSFRHTFKDKAREVGATEDATSQLMGHAMGGTTERYGTKRKPKPVPIRELDRIIQSITWDFERNLLAPEIVRSKQFEMTF